MNSGWSQPSNLIAAALVVVSCLGLLISWRRKRRADARDDEESRHMLSCDLGRGIADWTRLQLKVENFAPVPWTLRDVRVIRPKGTRLIPEKDARASYKTSTGAAEISQEKLDAAPAAVTALDVRVGAARSQSLGSRGGRGDILYSSVLLRFPPNTNGKLILEVTAQSADAIPKRHTYRIVRPMPKAIHE